MGAAKKLIDRKVLRNLVPINALSAAHIEEISKKAIIEEIRSGRYVFKKGDRDNQSVYLLEGKVELLGKGRDVVDTVVAGSETARHPLAHKQPRQLSIRAAGKVTVARLDSGLLDVLLTWDESSGYDVVEIDAQDDDDWMTRMLQSQAFMQLPPSNIHQLLMRLESITADAGDKIVNQGDNGDFFYIVKSGRLAVTRKASARSNEVLLAELGEGACFGEEALVSGTKRNASVTMVTQGTLMRLSKDDFNELLCAPLVHEVNFAEAQKMADEGAQWLDVRLPGEFENQAIKGSINLPLSALRDQADELLDKNTNCIVCCDTGRRSAAGAFVLSQRGFSVYVLQNGLMDVADDAQVGASTVTAAPEEAEVIPFSAEAATSAGKDDDTVAAPRAATAEQQQAATRHTSEQNDSKKAKQQVETLENRVQQEQKLRAELEIQVKQAQESAQSLQSDVDKLRSQLQVREQELEEKSRAGQQLESGLKADLGSAQQDLEKTQRSFESAEREKQQLQDELNRLQQTLSQIQDSAEGRGDALRNELEQMAKRLEREQQAHRNQTSELEQNLEQVREDYQQLGQRASALAGERDAARKDSGKLQQNIESLQEQLNARHGAAEEQTASLQAELEARDRLLQEEKQQHQSLQQQLDDLERNRQELEKQFEAVRQDATQVQASQEQLQGVLGERDQQLADLKQQLQQAGAREQDLKNQLEAEAQKVQDGLELARAEVSGEQQDLSRRIEELQSLVTERDQQLQESQAQREGQEQQLLAAQQSLKEIAERDEQAQQQLQQAGQQSEQLSGELEKAGQQIDELQHQLEAAQKQQATELESTLEGIKKEYESEISSVRDALSRAQNERENIKRDRAGLMETLRKAERDLERERADHETAVLRLRKELEESAGESAAGLASELEALQEQLKQGASQRDDLEIQLGERSAQLGSLQGEVEKLVQQLQQAQVSAREAEQQLLEANQAANEEMQIRLQTEQDAQQTLREEIGKTTAERDDVRERLTIQEQELEDLRAALQKAQQQQLDAQAAEKMQEAERALRQAEQERDALREAEQQARQEADQLRAEAEVTRGLVEMQEPAAESNGALVEELDQTKKNLEVAVSLRSAAEQQASDLQREVGRLNSELDALRADGSRDVQSVQVPSLDENDPHATTVMQGHTPAAEVAESGSGAVLLSEEVTDVGYQQPLASAEVSRGGGWKGVLLGLVLGGAAASGAFWWFSQQSATGVPGVADSMRAQPESGTSSSAKGDKAAVAKPASAKKATKKATKEAAKPKPLAKQKDKAEPEAAAGGQPAGSFRERLSNGGKGPSMVELHQDRFEMGSGSTSQNFDERPRHTVRLERFAISKNEVTFDQYDRFAKATGRSRPGDAGWGRAGCPVINVSWRDAVAYAQWLSKQTGHHYRLPSEAEWEFAARAGSLKRYSWGSKAGDSHANCFDCGGEWAGRLSAPVASFEASAYGLHDMSGNVREWVQDCYTPNYKNAPSDGSAVESPACGERVIRGGSYASSSSKLRSAARDRGAPDARVDDLGFRVVREF